VAVGLSTGYITLTVAVGLSTGYITLRAYKCKLGLTAAGLPTAREWKTAHFVGTAFTKLRLFSHKVPFIMKTISVPLLVTLYTGTVKRFAEPLEPFIHAVASLRRLQNGVLRVHPSGTKRWKLNQDCRRDEIE
jgi:hypothetical protein